MANLSPEQQARENIDNQLKTCGWILQDYRSVNVYSADGIAVREYPTDDGPADYVLFVDRSPVGVIEAKREDEGHRISSVEEQSQRYAVSKLKYLNNDPLPPETFREWLRKPESMRQRLQHLPFLPTTGSG